MDKPQAKISICIPVYNVEQYIERCARSLFEQTLDCLEYIFIDDGSHDRSVDILKKTLLDYPERQAWTKILCHDKNRGVSATRKEAMNLAQGNYIIHCDGDDWVGNNMYEKMYQTIIETDADLVYCDFLRDDPKSKNDVVFSQPDAEDFVEFINLMIKGPMHGSLWNKLYKRTILDHTPIDCPDAICMCEDLRINVQLLQKCIKIVHIPLALYHYTLNQHSLTTSYRGKQSFLSEVDNIHFFERILTAESRVYLDAYKRRTLFEALLANGMEPSLWSSLWKDTKRRTWRSHYPLKLKLFFYLACLHYPTACWLYSKYKKVKK